MSIFKGTHVINAYISLLSLSEFKSISKGSTFAIKDAFTLYNDECPV